MTEELIKHDVCPKCKSNLYRYDNMPVQYLFEAGTRTVWECPKCRSLYAKNNE